MFKRLLMLLFGLILIAPLAVCAEESDPTIDQLESGMISIDNPFLPKLPQPIKKEELALPPSDASLDSELTDGNGDPETDGESQLGEIIEAVIEERPLPAVVISGIIWNSDRPQAIIDGRIVEIGDTISEIEITNIHKTGVEGLFDGRAVILKP